MNLKATAILTILVACAMVPSASALPAEPIKTTPLPAKCELSPHGVRCHIPPCELEAHYDEYPVYVNPREVEVGVTAEFNPERDHGEQWGPYTGYDADC